MRARVLLVLSLLVVPAVCLGAANPGSAVPPTGHPATADSARFSPERVWREIRSDRTIQVTRVDRIPATVLRLPVLTVSGNGRMANPGEDWNAGCVQDGKVPGAQLVFAARTPHGWFVHSLHGGYFTSRQLVFVWDGADPGPVFRIDRPVPEHAGSAPRRTAPWPASLEELQLDLRPEWIVADPSLTPAR
jgi:hypothetical protein